MNSVENAAVLERSDIMELSSDAWFDRLLSSVTTPVQASRTYPGFPDPIIQKTFVGSAYEDALNEARRFYDYVMKHLGRRKPKDAAGRYLDFGCGWGRISRFFLHDFERGDIAGVDVDPTMVAFCQNANIPGSYMLIGTDARLPFGAESFQLITAYSVFSHLPEHLFRYWVRELLRVAAPGGVIAFTVEPERFLDFVSKVDPETTESPWYASLHAKLGDIEARKRELREAGITYLPTGGGPYRPVETYGDTVVTPDFIRDCVGTLGNVAAFIDKPSDFWQAVVVVRKKRQTSGLRRLLSQ